MKCVYNYCIQSCVLYLSIPFPCNCNQSIPFYPSIGIDNRYQSITTQIFAIDWSLIININRLIDIDWYRFISIVINYRFDFPGLKRVTLDRATTECRATLDHLFYMCQNLLKNEAEYNRHYCDSIRCK